MINWDHYRSLFPVTKNSCYFQTAGAGPIPLPVLESITKRYQALSHFGGESYQENIETMERCRGNIAKLINADADDVAFIPSVSFSMNALAHSFITKPKLIIPEEEFPSSMIPWKNLGYDISFVSSKGDLQTNLIQEMNHSPTKTMMTSLVQYSSGYKLDLNELNKKRNPEQTPLIINATQSIGSFPVDVKKSKIDILVAACHKWLFCGEGISFLYINKKVFENLKPAIVGWRSSPFAMQFNQDFKLYDSAKVFDIGWPNMAIFSGLDKALDIIFELQITNISSRIIKLMNYLIAKLKDNNMSILHENTSNHYSGIVCLGPFPEPDHILSELSKRGVFVNRRGAGIRIAIHFYNNETDIDTLISALKELI